LQENVKNQSLLLVEDDELVAAITIQMLEDDGYQVVHANTILLALTLLEKGEFTVAVLDIQIADASVFPVARRLSALDVPYVFVSGAHGATIPSEFRDRPFFIKPYRPRQLLSELEKMTGA
jgi:DNA-binding response OmpR family regulator